MIPQTGSVLGIDVGFSTRRKSSAICRLEWTEHSLSWSVKRFRAIESERHDAIAQIVGDAAIEAVALDGPLRGALDEIGIYRAAERMLTRGFQPLIGKPGQSSSPVGKRLNAATNDCAKSTIAIAAARLRAATHANALHALALAEAFPSAFLGVMIEHPGRLAAKRRNRSDQFFIHVSESGQLEKLLKYLLPGRQALLHPSAIINHDERAAFICALTALCVAADKFAAVGDENGWIVLPPSEFVRPWAMKCLQDNAEAITTLHIEA